MRLRFGLRWHRVGLFPRIFLPAVLLIATIGSLRTWVLLEEEREAARTRVTTSLRIAARVSTPLLAEYAITGDWAAARQLLRQQVRDWPELGAATWRPPGGVAITVQQQASLPSRAPAWFARLAAMPDFTYRYPVEAAGGTYGVLEFKADPRPAVELAWQRVRAQILAVAAAILGLAALLALVLESSLAAVARLRNQLAAFRHDHGVRVRPGGARELRELATHFNAMADEIQGLVQSLARERERSYTTLMSIGDAVIVTDAEGRITDMNPVACKLTAWEPEEASGRPLTEVFAIINEQTRAPAENPVARVLREGVVVGLANHTALVRRDGTEIPIEDSAAPIRLRDGRIDGCVLVFHDVSEKKQLLERLAWNASHDALTGLPNRLLILDRLQQAMARAQRDKTLLAVCYLDLDGFKPINDSYGHGTGDQVLVAIARRLERLLRRGDTVGRIGGDEFVLLLTDLESLDQAQAALERIRQAVSEPVVLEDGVFHVTASVGATFYPLDDADADLLLRHADAALYEAKQSGRDRYRLFDVSHHAELATRAAEIGRMRAGLARGEFLLYYQPKIDLRQGRMVDVEALLRWNHPERGLLTPGSFLPLIERDEFSVTLGEWVIETALQQIACWQDRGLDIAVAVNIAPRHFMEPTFPARLEALLARHPEVPPGKLTLEIVESAALENLDDAARTVDACHRLGVTFALDDFGTGHASLAYLKRLPADCVKIDQTFVRDMLDDPGDMAVVEAVITLARVFERKVVAEGVEEAEQGVMLMRLGCDIAQGYGIARPMPAEDFPGWIARFRPDPQWALWADTRWELDDFPLLVAQHDHLRWVKRVLLAADGAVLTLDPEELHDHTRCRFGHWYRGHGRMRYGHLPSYAAVDPVHRRVHQLGPEILAKQKSGDEDGKARAIRELLGCKDRLLELLAHLQKEAHAEHVKQRG